MFKKYLFFQFLSCNCFIENLNTGLDNFLSFNTEIFREFKSNLLDFFFKKQSLNFHPKEIKILYLLYLNILQFVITLPLLLFNFNLVMYIGVFLLAIIKIIYNFYVLYYNNEVSKILFLVDVFSIFIILVLFLLYGQISIFTSLIFFILMEVFQIYYISDIIFNIWKEKVKMNE
jgi:hypothetical protein